MLFGATELGQLVLVKAQRSRALIAVACAIPGLIGAGVIEYVIGHGNPEMITVHTGTAYETTSEGTATAGGVSYTLPVNVSWIDSAGAIHDGRQRPSCIHLEEANHGMVATMNFPIAGATEGTVVWVQC